VEEPRAVTVDAYGTLLRLRYPVPALREALLARGVERTLPEVERAFRAEVDWYVPRAHEGRDEATLALLQRDAAQVFLDAAGAQLDADEFAQAFVDALQFEPEPGAVEACAELREHGIPVAVVSNWDVGLHEHVRALGLDVPVVTSAEAGAPKPDPAVFRLALARLGVAAEEAVHVGDSDADRDGAAAAGMRFVPAPLAHAVRRILPPSWGPGRIVAWCSLVAALALANYSTRYAGPGDSASRNALYKYSTAAGGVVQYALIFGFAWWIASVDTRRLFALRQPRSWGRALALCLLVAVGIYVLQGIVSVLPLESPGKEQGLTPSHWNSRYALPFALNAIPIVVLAPFVEELTFRGVGFGLLERWGRPFAIVATGLAFGLAHGVLVGLLVLVPFGVMLAWLRARTESVLPGMLVHATFNAIALLAVLAS
jgi:putative hydrolase of the HAD superfamily